MVQKKPDIGLELLNKNMEIINEWMSSKGPIAVTRVIQIALKCSNICLNRLLIINKKDFLTNFNNENVKNIYSALLSINTKVIFIYFVSLAATGKIPIRLTKGTIFLGFKLDIHDITKLQKTGQAGPCSLSLDWVGSGRVKTREPGGLAHGPARFLQLWL